MTVVGCMNYLFGDCVTRFLLRQALKSAAVWYGMTGNATLRNLSLERMQRIDHEWGLPTGMFNGDEITPSPHTRSPSRGIELCGVVEAMFSYVRCIGGCGVYVLATHAWHC